MDYVFFFGPIASVIGDFLSMEIAWNRNCRWFGLFGCIYSTQCQVIIDDANLAGK
jgi:hypothetical protein